MRNGPECPTCGRRDFKTERGMKVHHNVAHDVSLKPRVGCEQCGEQFKIKPYRKDTAQFCSKRCQNTFYQENHRETLVCNECEKEYDVRASIAENSQFCSRECKRQSQIGTFSGVENPRWKGGPKTISCEVCGVNYEIKQAKADTSRFCSYECKYISQQQEMRGRGNPHWKGGFYDIASIVRSLLGGVAWDRLAKQARESKCACCGTVESENQRAYHVHHIIPVLAGGTNAYWNLITLCPKCHRRAEEFTKTFVDPVLIDHL